MFTVTFEHGTLNQNAKEKLFNEYFVYTKY